MRLFRTAGVYESIKDEEKRCRCCKKMMSMKERRRESKKMAKARYGHYFNWFYPVVIREVAA